jgi:hypothetical protein
MGRAAIFWLAAVAAMGCGSRYDVRTCSFAVPEVYCAPIAVADLQPQSTHLLHYALVAPNLPQGAPPCSGSLTLEVNSQRSGPGKMRWEAHEQDPAADCAQVGEGIEGSAEIGERHTEDLFFPQGKWTFRLQVTAVD